MVEVWAHVSFQLELEHNIRKGMILIFDVKVNGSPEEARQKKTKFIFFVKKKAKDACQKCVLYWILSQSQFTFRYYYNIFRAVVDKYEWLKPWNENEKSIRSWHCCCFEAGGGWPRVLTSEYHAISIKESIHFKYTVGWQNLQLKGVTYF